MLKDVIRVDTYVNYNYSKKEAVDVKSIVKQYPSHQLFVNSNSFTKITGKLPAVITVNPYLDKFIAPKGNIKNIKACRVKYVANPTKEVAKAFKESVKWCKFHKIPILITYMRFRTKLNLAKYTKGIEGFYHWKKPYYKINTKKTWRDKSVHYCDLKDEGCSVCGNCARLTFGLDDANVYSLNLESSGPCKFKCPDCYGKSVMKWAKIKWDVPIQNTKMKRSKK